MFEENFKKSLGSDNHSGVHPKIFEALAQVNHSHAPSYGTDSVSESCQQRIRQLFGETVQSYFVFNGTAANVLCLKSLLKSHHAVFCAESSHLHQDECGAPEAQVGCKLIPLASPDGKITPAQIEQALIRRGDQHYSQAAMISITQPTEVGTLYSLEELAALRELADRHKLFLHVDGARLIQAAHALDVSLKEALGAADVVSFGGTKNGLLFGEMVLLFHPQAQEGFKFLRKQSMQLPSKMRFVAAQFLQLLGPDQLWKEIADHSQKMARHLAARIEPIPELQTVQKVQSNAVFVKMPKAWLKSLREHSFFYVWDEKEWVARWMMSFDSQKEDIDSFVDHIEQVRNQ